SSAQALLWLVRVSPLRWNRASKTVYVAAG
ncbi:unnamed protein product, partial [Tilletia laevis]